MSDLSHLLGHLYGDPEPDSPPVPAQPASPAPAAEATEPVVRGGLHRAFADWLPGPGPLAPPPAPERPRAPSAPPPSQSIDDDLAAALSAALVEVSSPQPPPQPPQPAAPRTTPLPPLVTWDEPPASRKPASPPAPVPYDDGIAATATPGPAWTDTTLFANTPAPAPVPQAAPPATAWAPAPAAVAFQPDPVEATPAEPWKRGDDDIIPGSGRSGRQRRGRRR